MNEPKWRKSLAETYQKHHQMLYRIAFAYLKNAADSEDVVHDCFMKLLHEPRAFKSQEHEKAWLIVVAGNLAKDKLKESSRKNLDLDALSNYLVYKSDGDDYRDFLKLILTLPERLILPVYLYYYEGYKTAEIARILRLKPSTLRNQLRDARQILRIKLEAENE
ncbi:MAG: RNA polymerase sigma factor [Eubacteriales bacterium]|nr:RNA polymerase sigma factor [Eubacteriales bacterium]